jgi:HPt (histidine-containing phosphotransfer) domain-containing protein
MTSSAYNHSLLKTIRAPLHESLARTAAALEAVLGASLPAKDIVAADINNVIGSVTMVGRPSLVVIAHLLKDALVALERSEAMAWDTIQVAAVARPAMELTRALSDLLVALERGDLADQQLPGSAGEASTMMGEASSSVQLAPLIIRLSAALGQPAPDLARLFDPDPVFPGMEFAALDPAALRDVSAVHVARLDQAVSEYLARVPLPMENAGGTSLPPGQAFLSPIPEGARSPVLPPEPVVLSADLQDLLNTVGAVSDWAFVQKHRMGYQGYWMAWRARIAWELQKAALNQSTDAVALGVALDLLRTEMRKFAGDVRRPRPAAMFQVLEPLLRPWPQEWTARVQPLADAALAFGLPQFWTARARAEKSLGMGLSPEPSAKSSGAPAVGYDQDFRQGSFGEYTPHGESPISPIISDPIQAAAWRSAVLDIQSAWTGFASPPEGSKSDPMPLRRGLSMFLPRYSQATHAGSADFRASLELMALHLDPETPARPSPDVVQEEAVLLVLLDDDIARAGRWPAEWPEKAALAHARVQAAWSGQVDVLQSLPAVVWDATRRRQQSQDAVARIARVVMEDLRGVEEVFDEFIRRDASEARAQTDDVRARLNRNSSVMRSIGQHTAADILDIIALRAVAMKKAPREAAAEMADVTVGLASVSAFLESFGRGAPDALALLTASRQRFGLTAHTPDHLFADFTGDALARSMPVAADGESGEEGSDEEGSDEQALDGQEANLDSDSVPVAGQVLGVETDSEAPVSVGFDDPALSDAAGRTMEEMDASDSPTSADSAADDFSEFLSAQDTIPDAAVGAEAADQDSASLSSEPASGWEGVPDSDQADSDQANSNSDETRQSQLDTAQASARSWMDGVLDQTDVIEWQDRVTDPDIAEALFEEAGEVLSGLGSARQAWRADPTNTELLTDVRRAFHTIKGSGRTASLFGVGEYARVLEDRLTSVREEVHASSEMSPLALQALDDLLDWGQQTLATALDELSERGSFTFGVANLEELARRVAESYAASEVPDLDESFTDSSAHEAEAEEGLPAAAEPALDPDTSLPSPPDHDRELHEEDPVLVDVQTHVTALLDDIDDPSGPNPSRLMWSVHTIKSLAYEVHPRLSGYARRLEELLEPWSDLHDEAGPHGPEWTDFDRVTWRWHAATVVDLLRQWQDDPSAFDLWSASADMAAAHAHSWSGFSSASALPTDQTIAPSQEELAAVAHQVGVLAAGLEELGDLLARLVHRSGV